MKLYATVSSERASKGQGGNEYLHITIMGENGSKIMVLLVDERIIYFVRNAYPFQEVKELNHESELLKIKAKRQKGDEDICKVCGYHVTRCKCVDNL